MQSNTPDLDLTVGLSQQLGGFLRGKKADSALFGFLSVVNNKVAFKYNLDKYSK